MSDAKDVVRRFFDTLGTGDFARIGEFFTDDSVWMVNDVARGLPRQQGRKAIIDDFLQPIREGLFEPGDPKVEIRSMIAEGDRVAQREPLREPVRVHHRGRGRLGEVPARVHGLRLRPLGLRRVRRLGRRFR
jgi:ketosteroid isomerase-like protein